MAIFWLRERSYLLPLPNRPRLRSPVLETLDSHLLGPATCEAVQSGFHPTAFFIVRQRYTHCQRRDVADAVRILRAMTI